MVFLNGQNKIFTKFTHFSKQSFFKLKLEQLKLIFCCRIILPIGEGERERKNVDLIEHKEIESN